MAMLVVGWALLPVEVLDELKRNHELAAVAKGVILS